MKPETLWWAVDLVGPMSRRLRCEMLRRGIEISGQTAFALARWRQEGEGVLTVKEVEAMSGAANASRCVESLIRNGLAESLRAEGSRYHPLRMTPRGREVADALLEIISRLHAPAPPHE